MRETVLLSIKPEFAERIFSGEKQFEFRRTLFKEKGIKRVLVYASSPVRKVIGEFEIDEPLSMSKHALWRRTRKKSGISWKTYEHYFTNKTVCHAIPVLNPTRYRVPVHLSAIGLRRPPQSFAYVQVRSDQDIGQSRAFANSGAS